MIKLILLVVVGFLAAKFLFNFDPKNLIKPVTQPIIKQAPVSIFNLERYTDQSLNFAINHPVGWIVAPYSNELVIASTAEGVRGENRKEQIRIAIKQILLPEEKTLEEYVNSTQVEGVVIKSRKNLTLDGRPAISVIQERVPPVEPAVQIIYLMNGDRFYSISVTPLDSELMPVFEQLLVSFKFLS